MVHEKLVTLKRARRTEIVREEGWMMKCCVNFTQYTALTHAHIYTVNPFGNILKKSEN